MLLFPAVCFGLHVFLVLQWIDPALIQSLDVPVTLAIYYSQTYGI